ERAKARKGESAKFFSSRKREARITAEVAVQPTHRRRENAKTRKSENANRKGHSIRNPGKHESIPLLDSWLPYPIVRISRFRDKKSFAVSLLSRFRGKKSFRLFATKKCRPSKV